ncbi:hypothetical protein X777_11451 [Ooceraea biroi]|uniref:Uncharacterized protein n=1 Tax=Ooceraea biroi TaxID=2015173 RepID=A0A026W1Q8_OOCBI|nr:hypothetical protein X777_11451 [Ooceraea biroi]
MSFDRNTDSLKKSYSKFLTKFSSSIRLNMHNYHGSVSLNGRGFILKICLESRQTVAAYVFFMLTSVRDTSRITANRRTLEYFEKRQAVFEITFEV